MKYTLFVLFSISIFIACEKNSTKPENSPIATNDFLADSLATQATIDMFTRIKSIAESGEIIFGQEFPTDMRVRGGLNSDFNQSDCKDIVGEHPGLHGSDFLYYLYKDAQERAIHVNAVNEADKRGALVTFDFHIYGRNTTTYRMDGNEGLVDAVLGDSTERAWLYSEFDRIIPIIKSLNFPIIFRPWHEMNGGWFWWHTSPEKYVQLWQLTVAYFAKQGVHNVLWCWSPNYMANQDYWLYFPGEAFVDVIGLDAYQVGDSIPVMAIISNLEEMTDFAAAHNKIAAFTETGNSTTYPAETPRFWTQDILWPILRSDKAKRIAWILTWINTDWGSGDPTVVGYIPHKELANSQAKADFIDFYKNPATLFEDGLAALP